jgi:hypothetical protein
MQKVKAKKLLVLLVAHAIVYQNQAITIFHQQTAHGPGAHIIAVGWIVFLP